MESREIVKKKLLENKSGVIELKTYFGYTGHKRRVRPKWDQSAQWYKGVPLISDEMRKSGKPFVNPEDRDNQLANVELTHAMEIDLSSPTERMKLTWMLECDNAIALTYEEGLENPDQTFYVYNKEVEVKKTANRYETIDTAILELRKLSQDSLYSAARLMGYRMNNSEPEELRNFIRELFADKNKGYDNADKFLSVVNDTDKAIKLFIYKSLDKGIITNSSRGEYKFKDHFIGLSFESVIAWMKDKENQDLVLAIQEEVGDVLPVDKKSPGRPKTTKD